MDDELQQRVAIWGSDEIDRDCDTVAAWLADGAARLIDVREPHEAAHSMIVGAEHVPIDTIAWQVPDLDLTGRIVIHCRLGIRASMVARALRSIGIEAYNLSGGMVAWDAAGLPVSPNGAGVAEH